MLDGKKGTAEAIMYNALQLAEERTGTKAMEVLEQAMNNVMPVVEVSLAVLVVLLIRFR